MLYMGAGAVLVKTTGVPGPPRLSGISTKMISSLRNLGWLSTSTACLTSFCKCQSLVSHQRSASEEIATADLPLGLKATCSPSRPSVSTTSRFSRSCFDTLLSNGNQTCTFPAKPIRTLFPSGLTAKFGFRASQSSVRMSWPFVAFQQYTRLLDPVGTKIMVTSSV